MSKAKRLDYEILRLIAIFGVVFNHTQLRGWELYSISQPGSVNFVASLLLGILCKVAVPLFFLISGGLLLHKEEPVSVVLRKRVCRMVVVLVLFSAITYVGWYALGAEPNFGFLDFLRQLWSTGISIPYWYLYAYLGLLLMLLLLRPMVQGMEDSTFRYLLALHVLLYWVLGTIRILTDWGSVHSDFRLPVAEHTLFYFIMGYYLAHRFSWEKVQRKQLGILWLASAVCVAVMYLLARLNIARYGVTGMDFRQSFLAVPVFTIYTSVHQWCAWHTIPPKAGKIITTLGSCVFGTYLLEGVLRRSLDFIYLALEPKIHVLPACLVWVTAVVAAGLAVTWVLKKLPGFRKLL